MFKKMILGLAAVGVMSAAAVAMAAPSDAVIAAAKAQVPAGCAMYGYEEGKKTTEVYFNDAATMTRYEVKLSNATGKVVELDIEPLKMVKATKVEKTPAQIQELILAAYPDAVIKSIKVDQDDSMMEYEVKFATAKALVKADMSPVTGEFGKIEYKYL